jgi:hypothetical protein
MKRPIIKPEIREFFIDDKSQDKIVAYHYPNRIKLMLSLEAENKRERLLGTVTLSTKTIKIKRIKEKHLFRKANAWGFCDAMLKKATTFNKVWLTNNYNEEWKIPVEYILNNGFYLDYNKKGYELQIFIELDKIEKFRLTKKDKETRRW